MQNAPRFEKQYKRLNKAQKQAVDTIDGPVMVVAGPGTGKTTVLTLRIAQILKQTDTKPENILALTFTDSGVFSMRRALVDTIGADGYRVGIFTFHGFANEIIARHPSAFAHIAGGRHIADVDQLEILENIFDQMRLKSIKPFGNPFYYVKPVLDMIQTLKRENISPQELKKLYDAEKNAYEKDPNKKHTKGVHKGKIKLAFVQWKSRIDKGIELAQVYKKYQGVLREEHLYDYEDMIVEVVHALESNDDLRLELQETYQYLLADEHQDANRGQNRILELLATYFSSPNLFVVGDHRQAIYRFQGASVENFLYFEERFPKTKVISLSDNYRSTQPILDASHGLMSTSVTDERLPSGKLNALADHTGRNIEAYYFSDITMEHHFIAHDVAQAIKDGVNPNEIAVVYRDNKDAFPIAAALEREHVPYVIESSENVLTDSDVEALLLIAEAACSYGDEEKLVPVLYLDVWGISMLSVHKLLTYRRSSRKNLYTLLESRKELERCGAEHKELLLHMGRKLATYACEAGVHNPSDFFEYIVRDAGLLSKMLSAKDSVRRLSVLESFLDAIQRLSTTTRSVSAVLRKLERYDRYNIKIPVKRFVGNDAQVHLMTAHKAKGLEFDSIYIAGLTNGHWGNRRTQSHFHIPIDGLHPTAGSENEDDRRLFYVALTRARKHAILTCAMRDAEGKERLPSQFIEELPHKTVRAIQTEQIEETLSSQRFHMKGRKRYHVSIDDKAYLNKLFLEQGLSVTALNNYLACPWRYFFESLIRLPSNPSGSQIYGTAIHAALTRYFSDTSLSTAHTVELFQELLTASEISDRDLEVLLARGKEALTGYLKNKNTIRKQSIECEVDIAGVQLVAKKQKGHKSQKVHLHGKIDQVRYPSPDEAIVVDYKTGKIKSKNAMLGITKSGDGNYFRQLVFYKMLLEATSSVEVVTGEIDFIEPSTRGDYRCEQFVLSESDVTELKETIQDIAENILSLSFWDSMCDRRNCEHCALSKVVKKLK